MSELGIGDLARRTGLTPQVIRAWETRFGFPQPRRTPSGRRTYDPRDVDRIARVLTLKESGSRLAQAIARVVEQGDTDGRDLSVYGELRRLLPHLASRVMRRDVLVAISRAIEDEALARAVRPLVFGAFQREEFYLRSAPRWRELARTAEGCVVFADFAEPPTPVRVRSGCRSTGDSPLLREWAVVVRSADFSTVLTAWEVPEQRTVRRAAVRDHLQLRARGGAGGGRHLPGRRSVGRGPRGRAPARPRAPSPWARRGRRAPASTRWCCAPSATSRSSRPRRDPARLRLSARDVGSRRLLLHQEADVTAEEVRPMELTSCPECGAPARDRGAARAARAPTDPIEHAKVRCVTGHGFFLPVALGSSGVRASLDAPRPGERPRQVARSSATALPPSTTSTCPVVYAAPGAQSSATAVATSSAVPLRPDRA